MMNKKQKMRQLSRVRNKKVEFFYYDEEGEDEYGFPCRQKVIFRECWASVRGLRGREFYNAAAVQAQDDKIINCRFFKGLTPDMYVELNGKKYNITSINNLYERNEEYEIHIREVQASE